MHLCCRLGISSLPLAGPAGCARIASGRPARGPDDSLPPPVPSAVGSHPLAATVSNQCNAATTHKALGPLHLGHRVLLCGMLRICRAPSQPVELTHVSPIAVRLKGTDAGDSPSPRRLLQTHQTSRQASTACQVPSWKMRKEHEPWNRGGPRELPPLFRKAAPWCRDLQTGGRTTAETPPGPASITSDSILTIIQPSGHAVLRHTTQYRRSVNLILTGTCRLAPGASLPPLQQPDNSERASALPYTGHTGLLQSCIKTRGVSWLKVYRVDILIVPSHMPHPIGNDVQTKVFVSVVCGLNAGSLGPSRLFFFRLSSVWSVLSAYLGGQRASQPRRRSPIRGTPQARTSIYQMLRRSCF